MTATNAAGSTRRDVDRERRRRRRRRRSTRRADDLRHGPRRPDADRHPTAPGPAPPPITYTYQWQSLRRRRRELHGHRRRDRAHLHAHRRRRRPRPRRQRHGDERGGHRDLARHRRPTVVRRPARRTRTAPAISGTARDGSDADGLERRARGPARRRSRYTYAVAALRRRRRELRRPSPARPAATYTVTSADVGRDDPRRRHRDERRGHRVGRLVRDGAGRARRRRSTPSPPTISGTATDGQTLTRRRRHAGPAPRTITYTYQWQRCDAAGANCADIAGATSATYRTVAADVGSTHPRRRDGDERRRQRDRDLGARPAVVARPPPVNTAPPAISGTPRDGQTLTARPRHVDRHAADHLHLPVAALRRGRHELRGHRGRDGERRTR